MNFFSLFKRNIIYKLKKKINIDNDNFENKSLDDLFHHYGSDKANIWRPKNLTGHGYSVFYNTHFKNLKQKKINILEIGSFSGASAAAFSKYFPKSNIYCFDINISNFKFFSNRIHVFGVDIKDHNRLLKTLKKILNKDDLNNFDIIIDDGSHNLKDILMSIKFFFKYLSKKGLYIIEDFKFPNYFEYNRDVDDVLVDKLLENLSNKIFSNSSILKREDQTDLMHSIKKISKYKGNLNESDICFIEKN